MAARLQVQASKAGVVHYLRCCGKKLCTIAKELKISVSTVRRVLKRSPDSPRAPRKEARAESSKVKLRRDLILSLVGRKKTIAVAGDADGDEIVVGREFPTLRKVQKELSKRGHAVSVTTVLRDTRARGVSSRVRPRVGTNVAKKHAVRLQAAKRLLRFPMSKLLFCDETWANDNDNTSRWELVPPGEFATPRKHMKRASIKLMVWGLIGVGYKSPLVIFSPRDGAAATVTGAVYSRRCGRHIRVALRHPGGGRHFIQDNARPHIALGKKLADEGFSVPEWPPYSPDLNPIETVWASLHRRVSEKHPQSAAELRKATIEAWDELPQAEIDAHIRGFHKRLRLCISRDGAPS